MPDQSQQSEAAWPAVIAAALAGVAAIVILFRDGVAQVVGLWWSSAAHGHCALILPISLYLIHERRHVLAAMRPRASPWGLAVVAVSAAAWLLADMAGVDEVGHFAIVGMLQGVVLAVLGTAVYRALLFPLMILWLMVPTGGGLVPALQEVATVLSSSLLRLTGIPTFVDGTMIEVPTGRYFIAEGCAGLNFLLASLTVGLLFAHAIHRRWTRVVATVAAMLLLAVLANGVRIWGIIAIAEVTRRRIDIIDDHLALGWVFFSLVLVLAMRVAWIFRDPPVEPPLPAPPVRTGFRPAGVFMAAVAAVVVASAAPTARALTREPEPKPGSFSLRLPTAFGDWRAVPADTWSPRFPGAHVTLHGAFQRDERRVELFVAYYWRQDGTRKAVGAGNHLTAIPEQLEHPLPPVDIRVDGRSTEARATLLKDGGHRWLTWSWYWVGGRHTGSPPLARLLRLKAELGGGERRAAVVVIRADESLGADTLRAFLKDAGLTGLLAGEERGMALKQEDTSSVP
ncbi:MAG: EpsI family protein [Alphaproteobacteria bacterium]